MPPWIKVLVHRPELGEGRHRDCVLEARTTLVRPDDDDRPPRRRNPSQKKTAFDAARLHATSFHAGSVKAATALGLET